VKLTAQKDTTLDNDYVHVQYRELTPEIHKIFQICEDSGSILQCEKDKVIYKIDLNDILYIEWVDSKSCVYTKDGIYSTPHSLTQLEEILFGRHFIRISKMALVNLFKVESIANSLYFRLIAKMINGEKVVVTRHYRSALLSAIHELAKEV